MAFLFLIETCPYVHFRTGQFVEDSFAAQKCFFQRLLCCLNGEESARLASIVLCFTAHICMSMPSQNWPFLLKLTYRPRDQNLETTVGPILCTHFLCCFSCYVFVIGGVLLVSSVSFVFTVGYIVCTVVLNTFTRLRKPRLFLHPNNVIKPFWCSVDSLEESIWEKGSIIFTGTSLQFGFWDMVA